MVNKYVVIQEQTLLPILNVIHHNLHILQVFVILLDKHYKDVQVVNKYVLIQELI